MQNETEIENGGMKFIRTFNVSVEKVWKAWSDEKALAKWWGPKNWTAPMVKIDFKEGGKYLLCMRGAMAPGAEPIDSWSGGIYKEIVPMKKIVVNDTFTDSEGNAVPASTYGLPESFPMESEIIISFEKIESGTKLTINYPSITGIEGTMRDNMVEGWNQSLDKMAESLT